MPEPDRRLAGIVQSTWMAEYSSRLVERCRDELSNLRIDSLVISVPGAMTLAYGVRRLAASHPNCGAFATFALMVRGETSHADDITRASLLGLADTMRDLDRPIVCEFLVADSIQQLKARCGGDDQNRGLHAAHDIKALLDIA
jgi:6,7-dimethyl-8-ribityllumazine synthase